MIVKHAHTFFPRHGLGLYGLVLFTLTGVLILVSCAHSRYPTYDEELNFAVHAAQRGLWNEAAFRFQNLARTRPDDAFIQNNLAVAQEALGKYDEAEKTYKLALTLSPQSSIIQENYQRLKQILKEKAVKN